LALRRKKIDSGIEQKIITTIIVSDPFLREIYPALRSEYFQQPHLSLVAKWVIEYYSVYKKAPVRDIENIFLCEKSTLREEDAKMVETLLSSLSEKYEETGLNVDYLRDQTTPYFKERAIDLLKTGIEALNGAGRSDEAEKMILEYRRVSKTLSRWIDPFEPEYIRKVYRKLLSDNPQESEDYLFRYPGVLGDFFGEFRRGWFIAFEAPYKRGKTWQLNTAAIIALQAGLRVVFVSLEMEHEEVAAREYSIITSMVKDQGTYLFPIWDCKSNQDNSCKKRERINSTRLLTEDGKKPVYDTKLKYQACSICKGKKGREYKTSSWYESIVKEKTTCSDLISQIEHFSMSYRGRLKLIAYPAKTASLSQVLSDLDSLEFTDDFCADVIIVDYADILAPEDGNMETRHQLNEIWSRLKSIAQQKHALVISATQANKETLRKKTTSVVDASEDSRKLAHIDVMIPLSQTDAEKEEGIMRLGLFHRHRKFTEKTVTILQSLEMGQVIIDSSW